MEGNVNCPVCSQDCTHARQPVRSGVTAYACPTCGEYQITRPAILSLGSVVKEDKVKISAFLRERHIQKALIVTVVDQVNRTDHVDGPVVGIENISRVGFPDTVAERLDRILRNIHGLTQYPGARVRFFYDRDYPVFFAENDEAMVFLANTLQHMGWVTCSLSSGTIDYTLTIGGWSRIAELDRALTVRNSREAFVAMWFDDSLEKPYEEGFRAAIEAAGYKAVRMDLKEHNEKICDAIIAEIRKTRFMVADFTGHRGGVYFEAGYAQGLGIPVIWTCRDDHKDKLHFDTRQFNHIFWINEMDLFPKLRNRIEATISG